MTHTPQRPAAAATSAARPAPPSRRCGSVPPARAGRLAWLLLPLALAACGVDGVPSHPDGRPATELEQNRNVTISGSAAFGGSSGTRPPSSERW